MNILKTLPKNVNRKCSFFGIGSIMDKVQITLPQQLDMVALAHLKEELITAGASASTIVVDGSEVEMVGTPAIQLILAAAKLFASEGRPFALQAPSPALMSAFDDLGLTAEAREWNCA
jgi:anti-anti-sigma regulatory factor